MKTQASNYIYYTLSLVLTLFVFTISTSSMNAQSNQTAAANASQDLVTVKGIISNEDGPLESVNVILKGTKEGTVTNSKGEFTFPKKLRTGDVLLVSYLGYQTVEVKIEDDTTFIRLLLSEDLIEFVGELNTNKRYKSKRAKKNDQ